MPVTTARHAADLLAASFAGAEEEKLAVLYLDRERNRLGLDEYPGGLNDAALPLRAIVAAALRLDAHGIVIAHNHPSGDPAPSPADIAATRRLAETAEALGIQLHDHLIFAANECRSFRALGLL